MKDVTVNAVPVDGLALGKSRHTTVKTSRSRWGIYGSAGCIILGLYKFTVQLSDMILEGNSLEIQQYPWNPAVVQLFAQMSDMLIDR